MKEKIKTFLFDNTIKDKLTNIYFIYFLGYLWADGYTDINGNTVAMEIKSKDFEEIKFIFDKIGNFKIRERKRINSENLLTKISICNALFKNFLMENDFLNKKEKNLEKILSKIDENLVYYFWRGFSDGDGCFYFHNKPYQADFSFWSSINQDWVSQIKLVKSMQIKYTIYIYNRKKPNGKIHKSSRFSFRIRENIIKFGDFVYKNYEKDKIGLFRKYEKFKEIKNYKINRPLVLPNQNFENIGFRWQNNKWLLRLTINGKRKHIGYFNSELEALNKKLEIEKSNDGCQNS